MVSDSRQQAHIDICEHALQLPTRPVIFNLEPSVPHHLEFCAGVGEAIRRDAISIWQPRAQVWLGPHHREHANQRRGCGLFNV